VLYFIQTDIRVSLIAMLKHIIYTLCSCILILVLSNFFDSTKVYAASSEKNEVLAEVGQWKFTQQDFDRIIGYLPPSKQEILNKDLKQKARFLKALVEFKAIAMKAEQEGYDKRPDVQEQLQIKRDELLAKMYSSEKMKEMPQITDEDVELYYKVHKEEFNIPLAMKAKLVILPIPSDEEKAAKIRNVANALSQAMKNNASLETLLKELDKISVEYKIRDLWLKKGSVPNKVWDTIKDYKKDSVSPPIRDDGMLYIVKIKEIRPSRAMTLDEARPLIQKKLAGQLRREYAQRIVDDIMQQMDVTIFFDRLR